jgi:hypothetical protein
MRTKLSVGVIGAGPGGLATVDADAVTSLDSRSR